MTLREGPGAIGAERLGRMSEALHASLLQSNPPQPGGDPIVHVFPAWPAAWDTQFTLSARGGFVVTSSITHGEVEFVELRARDAGTCRLRNPWKTAGAA
ncbi:MAG TPA: glycoside hydrolase, partial [Terriglobia bacterium]|nr:glycoside hydrolase [Terriglobia bacterium]